MHCVCPPNFASTIVAECSWDYADLPRVFHNNSLCKIWGANRVHYGQLENSEWNISIIFPQGINNFNIALASN